MGPTAVDAKRQPSSMTSTDNRRFVDDDISEVQQFYLDDRQNKAHAAMYVLQSLKASTTACQNQKQQAQELLFHDYLSSSSSSSCSSTFQESTKPQPKHQKQTPPHKTTQGHPSREPDGVVPKRSRPLPSNNNKVIKAIKHIKPAAAHTSTHFHHTTKNNHKRDTTTAKHHHHHHHHHQRSRQSATDEGIRKGAKDVKRFYKL